MKALKNANMMIGINVLITNCSAANVTTGAIMQEALKTNLEPRFQTIAFFGSSVRHQLESIGTPATRRTTMRRLLLLAICICSIVLLGASPATAQVFVESDDAGSTFETAIAVGPSFNVIEGSLGLVAGEDTVDIFELEFADVTFSVFNLTWATPNQSNSSVTLYDEAGQVMDECINCLFIFGNQGVEILNATLSAGIYYLEIKDTTTASSPVGAYGLEFSRQTTLIFEDGFESGAP